jgi:hypothetical protein
VTGKTVEVYKNLTGIKFGFQRKKKPKRKTKKKVKEKTTELKEFAIYRCRREIKRRINSNTDMNKFITLTFAENLSDLQDCNKKFKAFIRKLKSVYPDLKYIAVPEFQKRGAVHYHLLSNIGYTENKALADIWGHGFVRINNINKVKNVGLYVSKYIGKDLKDERYFNNKKYFCSRKLNKPEIFYSPKRLDIESKCKNFKSVFKKSFQSYHGKIDYEIFEVDNKEKLMIE